MKLKQIIIAVSILLILLIVGFIVYSQGFFVKTNEKTTMEKPPQPSPLSIVSTNPNLEDGAFISFTQPVEITFSQAISKSELKYSIQPELEHTFEAIDTGNKDFGATYQLKFNKPLKSGEGFELTIKGETKTNEGQKLEKDYNFVIRTIPHKGA
jgi:hypothetical protein